MPGKCECCSIFTFLLLDTHTHTGKKVHLRTRRHTPRLSRAVLEVLRCSSWFIISWLHFLAHRPIPPPSSLSIRFPPSFVSYHTFLFFVVSKFASSHARRTKPTNDIRWRGIQRFLEKSFSACCYLSLNRVGKKCSGPQWHQSKQLAGQDLLRWRHERWFIFVNYWSLTNVWPLLTASNQTE